MKVGTDGVLLGAWANVARAQRILDLGCGSGLIALMAAQRNPGAHVTGVEIDPAAAADALANAEASPFARQVDVVCADALHFCPQAGKFDCIISNPPYHEEELLPPSALRATARHTGGGGLTFAALLRVVDDLLNKEALHASFNLILPAAALARFLPLAAVHGLFPVRRTHVVTRPGKPCKRVLLELSPHACPLACDELALLDDKGNRSEAYASLCRDFYL